MEWCRFPVCRSVGTVSSTTPGTRDGDLDSLRARMHECAGTGAWRDLAVLQKDAQSEILRTVKEARSSGNTLAARRTIQDYQRTNAHLLELARASRNQIASRLAVAKKGRRAHAAYTIT